MLGWQCRVVGETNQLGVSVIGCQVILGKEVGSEYSRLYIGYTKIEFEVLATNNNITGFGPVAVYISAVGGLKLNVIGALTALLRRRGND